MNAAEQRGIRGGSSHVGFATLHLANLLVLIPKLGRSTSVYGAIGAITTSLFWFYLVGRLVVTAPILYLATDEELHSK